MKILKELVFNNNLLNKDYRINSLGLKARDKQFLDRIFPQSKEEEDIVKYHWNGIAPLARIFNSHGLVILIVLVVGEIIDFSAERTLLFGGMIALVLSSGPSVFLRKEQINKLDEFIYYMLFLRKQSIIYFTKRSLCLSDKSSSDIRRYYVVYPTFLFGFMSLFSLAFIYALFGDETLIFNFFQNLFSYPTLYIEKNINFVKYNFLSIFLVMTLIYGPRVKMEVAFKEKGEFVKTINQIIFINSITVLANIIALIIGLNLALKSHSKFHTITDTFSHLVNSIELYGPVLFLYTQLWLVLTIHHLITIRYMNNKKANLLYILLLFLLAPYFIFYYIFIELLPNLIVYLASYVLLLYFRLCKQFFKIPSVVRASGFFIALFITIFKFMTTN